MEIVQFDLSKHSREITAKLIYETDKNLFSLIFGSNERMAIKLIESCIKLEQNTFSHRFIDVAINSDVILGIMISHRGGDVKKLHEDEDFIKTINLLHTIKLYIYDKFIIERGLTRTKNPIDYYISNLSVLENFRNSGVGSALLKKGIEKARALKCKRVILDVSVSNSKAKKLYEMFNFKVYNLKKANFFGKKIESYCMEYIIN